MPDFSTVPPGCTAENVESSKRSCVPATGARFDVGVAAEPPGGSTSFLGELAESGEQ